MNKISKKGAERGAALVELAIVLPFLLALLAGIVEFGLLFYNKQVITNASREGARAGITRTTDDITTIVEDYCGSRLISFAVVPKVDTTVTGVGGDYFEDLSVKVDYKYTFFMPGLIGLDEDLTLSAQTIMKMEMEEDAS
jgi:Flp pilus assembly protein TadG